MTRSHPLLLAVVFAAASLLLLGGRAAQARGAADPGPGPGELTILAADPAAPAGNGSLTLTTTVGLNPTCVGATAAITVAAGTPLTFCYHIVNGTGYTFTSHSLRDQLAENILNDTAAVLPPGASATFTRTVVATGSVLNTAVWGATQPITGYNIATGSCAHVPDLSAAGPALPLADDTLTNLTLPFDFQLYDRVSNRLRVSNNGAALLDEPTAGVSFGNSALPTSGLRHGLAVFWDDLADVSGGVYAGLYTYTTTSQAADGLLPDVLRPPGLQPQASVVYYVVEYHQRALFLGPFNPVNPGTFALMLLKPGQGADGTVVMCYQDTFFNNPGSNYGALATIGLNHDGGTAAQFSYNTAHPELTGAFGISYQPLGGQHAAATASSAARVTALTTVALPLIQR